MQNYLAGGLCSSQGSFTRDGQNLKIGKARTALSGQRGRGGVSLVLWLDHVCAGLLLARPVVLGLPSQTRGQRLGPRTRRSHPTLAGWFSESITASGKPKERFKPEAVGQHSSQHALCSFLGLSASARARLCQRSNTLVMGSPTAGELRSHRNRCCAACHTPVTSITAPSGS